MRLYVGEDIKEVNIAFHGKRQTANVNFYHVDKFPLYLSFTAHYNYTKIGRFTSILTIRIVLSCFNQLISHFERENFST